jgi:hypothetical protein
MQDNCKELDGIKLIAFMLLLAVLLVAAQKQV